MWWTQSWKTKLNWWKKSSLLGKKTKSSINCFELPWRWDCDSWLFVEGFWDLNVHLHPLHFILAYFIRNFPQQLWWRCTRRGNYWRSREKSKCVIADMVLASITYIKIFWANERSFSADSFYLDHAALSLTITAERKRITYYYFWCQGHHRMFINLLKEKSCSPCHYCFSSIADALRWRGYALLKSSTSTPRILFTNSCLSTEF